jgi:hypothetical protein
MKAQEYQKKWEDAGDDPEDEIAVARPAPGDARRCDVGRHRIVHHHTHRHDDIMTVLRLADEFGFRVVLHHVSEALEGRGRDRAFDRGVDGPDGEPWGAPCSVILVDSPGGKLEAVDLIYETGGGARAGRRPRRDAHRRLDHRLASVQPHGGARACERA